jgi:hypothetical protein
MNWTFCNGDIETAREILWISLNHLRGSLMFWGDKFWEVREMSRGGLEVEGEEGGSCACLSAGWWMVFHRSRTAFKQENNIHYFL